MIFNDGIAHQVPHMLLAAYVVGGFGVASVYAYGMLKGRRDRYHRLGVLIPLTVAAIAIPLQLFVGDFAARQVFDNQPVKFAAMEMVPTTSSDVPEILLGRYVDGRGRRRHPDPGPGVVARPGSAPTPRSRASTPSRPRTVHR